MKLPKQAQPIIKDQSSAKNEVNGMQPSNAQLQCNICCGLVARNPELVGTCKKIRNCKC